MEGKRKAKEVGHEKRSRKSSGDHNGLEDGDISAALELLLNTSSQHIRKAVQKIVEKEIGSSDPFARLTTLGSSISSAGQSIFQEYSNKENSESWPFSEDISTNIFSMVDTTSLIRASASCTLWRKLSQEPACYENVDLTGCGSNIPSGAVTNILERAGIHLSSLKLGLLQKGPQSTPIAEGSQLTSVAFVTPKRNATPSQTVQHSVGSASQTFSPAFAAVPYVDKGVDPSKVSAKLDQHCLDALFCSTSMAGKNLTTLHLYNIRTLTSKAVCRAIAACPHMEDLEIVGLQVSKQSIMECVGAHSPKLERFFFQPVKECPLTGTGWSLPGVRPFTYKRFVSGCSDLSSLTLRGGHCRDSKVLFLLKGLNNLKELDLSRADYLTGTFLQSLAGGGFGTNLEKLILRDCMRLKETCVESFLTSLLAGEMKQLRQLDISNKNRFASSTEWFARRLGPNINRVLQQLQQERPTLLISAEFSLESDSESLSLSESDDDSSDSDSSSSGSSVLGLFTDSDGDGDDDEDDDMSDDDDDEDDDNDADSQDSESDEGDSEQGEDDDEEEEEDDMDDLTDCDSDDGGDEGMNFSDDEGNGGKENSHLDKDKDCEGSKGGGGQKGVENGEVTRGQNGPLGDANSDWKEVKGYQERCPTNFSRVSLRRLLSRGL